MGCHTWFYKPYQINIEDAKVLLKRQLEEALSYYSYEQINSFDEDNKEQIQLCEQLLNKLQNNTITEDEIFERVIIPKPENEKRSNWDEYYLTEYVKNKGLFVDCNYHDLFRVWHYPDDKLFSYEQTVEFIENHIVNNGEGNGIYFLDDFENNIKNDKSFTLKRLKDFWDEYPDGMIMFG